MVHFPVPLIFEGMFLFRMILLIPGEASHFLCLLPPFFLYLYHCLLFPQEKFYLDSAQRFQPGGIPPWRAPCCFKDPASLVSSLWRAGCLGLCYGVCVCLSWTGLASYKQGIFMATSLRKVCERGRHFGLRTISGIILFTAAEAY